MKPKKKTTQNIPSAVQTPEEKCRSRYLFGALGQILYAMPSLALVGMIYVMGAALPGLIAAVPTGCAKPDFVTRPTPSPPSITTPAGIFCTSA